MGFAETIGRGLERVLSIPIPGTGINIGERILEIGGGIAGSILGTDPVMRTRSQAPLAVPQIPPALTRPQAPLGLPFLPPTAELPPGPGGVLAPEAQVALPSASGRITGLGVTGLRAAQSAGLFHTTPAGNRVPNSVTLVMDPASGNLSFMVAAKATGLRTAIKTSNPRTRAPHHHHYRPRPRRRHHHHPR